MEFAIQKWYKRITSKDKMIFGVTFICTLLTHAFKLLNFLPNHDGLYSFYSKQDVILSGRWVLKYAAGLSSYFDTQWLNGLLAVFYIAIAAIFVVKVLDIKNSFLACMAGVVLGIYPSVASTFAYLYTADAYYLAMLLAVLAAWLMTMNDWKKRLAGSVALGVSMGIYQAYLSFCIVLLMLWLIKKCFIEEKAIGRYIVNFLYSGVLGGLVYVLGLYIRLNGRSLSSYQGIDNSTLIRPLSDYINSFCESWVELIQLFAQTDVFTNVYIAVIVGAIWLAVLAMLVIRSMALIKERNYAAVLWTILFIVMLPFAVYCLKILSPSMLYHTLMVQSVAVIWILPILMLDNTESVVQKKSNDKIVRILQEIFLLGIIVIMGNWVVGSNIAYVASNMSYEKSYALSLRIADRIEQLESYEQAEKLYVAGNPDKYDYIDYRYAGVTKDRMGYTWGIIPYGNQMYINMINQYIGGQYDTLYTTEDIEKITSSDEFKAMPVWPSSESVQMIGDTIVVKLGE